MRKVFNKFCCTGDLPLNSSNMEDVSLPRMLQKSPSGDQVAAQLPSEVKVKGSPFATKDQLLGSFIGLCVGDALGFMVEGFNQEDSTAYVEQCVKTLNASELGIEFVNHRRILHPADDSRVRFKFGQYSDDSQHCRELLLSIKQCKGKFSPQVFAIRQASLFIPPNFRCVGIGFTCLEAATNTLKGANWEESGKVSARGNGAAMRVGPLGVLFHNDVPSLVRAAVDQARITHNSILATSSSLAIAAATAYAVSFSPLQSTTPFDAVAFCNCVASVVQPLAPEYASIVKMLPSFIPLSVDEAARRIVALGESLGDSKWGDNIISSSSAQASLWSVLSFISHPHSYIDCISKAIAVGGDVDTTAAMAGAISGAYLGPQHIPSRLAEKLNDNNEYKLDFLFKLVDDLFEQMSTEQIQYPLNDL